MMKFIPSVIVLASAYLTIQAPDKPVIVDKVKMSCSGDNIVVVVATKGDMPVKYQWYLYDKAIPGAIHSNYSLNKVMTEAVKNGALFCHVSNCGGKYEAVGMWKKSDKIESTNELMQLVLSNNQSTRQDIRR